MVQKRPPGNRVRTREHLHARRRAEEGRRVYERGDEPAGVWVCGRVARRRSALASNHCTGPFRPGRWLAGRGCGSGRGRGGRWPRRAVRGASLTVGRLRGRRPGDGEGVRGNRGGSRGRDGRPVGGGRWGIAGERAGGRTRWGRGERGGAWASVGDGGRGLASWRWAMGARGRLSRRLASWQRRWPVGSGRVARPGEHSGSGPSPGGGPGRHGGAAMGRRDARAVGERRRQESALSPAGDISRRHARTRPVRAYIYIYIYPCTFPSTHHGSPAHAW